MKNPFNKDKSLFRSMYKKYQAQKNFTLHLILLNPYFLEIPCVPQIREQMWLETNFQYEFSFWAVGAAKKKNPSYHKYATFEAIFLMFSL